MAKITYYDVNGNEEGKVKSWFLERKRQLDNFVETCKENKEACIAVASFAVPAIVEVGKLVVKHNAKKDETKHRKLDMWDPVEGHYWRLRREPMRSEYLEIERRVKNGESRGYVLEDMGLLR